MELEVVGRHALFFDDDSNAQFVNSKEALVEWNSLFIDRYDVRHLLSSPPASFKRLRQTSGSSPLPDSHLESEIDVERYADLPSPTSSDKEPPVVVGRSMSLLKLVLDIKLGRALLIFYEHNASLQSISISADTEADMGTINAGGFHAVSFSYGNTADPIEQKNDERSSEVGGFCPPFPVPENLANSLPSSEKIHQIIARTALFVSQHGGQSEIVLRVKQGDNPTFGFLMPHHHLHPYFRYLVDHPEILNASSDGNSQKGNNNDNQSGSPGTGGALSLLGSAYGSVEDEDVVLEDAKVSKLCNGTDLVKTSAAGDLTNQHQLKILDVLDSVYQKDERSSMLLRPSEDKASTVSKSGVSSTMKSKSSKNGKKEYAFGSSGADVNNSSARSLTAVGESVVIEPPSELKRLVDRVVEIILKNGQGFEALLIEQDKNHGRFPFLLSSNQYHPYYKKILRMAQESRVGAKSFGSDMDAASWQGADKKTGQSKQSQESAVQDLPFDCDRKEKFKMVLGKIKKEIQEQASKELQQPQVVISADAAAAIVQAATRGIKKPNLDIFSKNLGSGSDVGGRTSSRGSQQSSQAQSSFQKKTVIDHLGAPVSVAKEIAKTAAMVAAGEADSSEVGLTREQKLKAERLKRAKMFAAMIKSGAKQPLVKDPPQGLSAEPARSGPSGSAFEVGTQVVKDREGSSAPADVGTSHKFENSEKHLDKEMDEKTVMNKRHYRSKKHEEEDEEGDREEEESDKEYDRRSRKKHRSHHSSQSHRDHSKERRKRRRRHSSSKDKESRHRRHKHAKGSEDEENHQYHHHKHESSSEEEYESNKHKRHSSHRDKHEDDRRKKQKKRSKTEEGDLEEGEIRAKSSDQSLSSVVDDANMGKSLDRLRAQQEERASSEQPQTTVVSDDLRAKIRAMLLATL